jgi:hypothetical protein
LETFTEPKEWVENTQYQFQKQRNLSGLSDGIIDKPIIGLINAFNTLPHVFTLQSCYGHFVYGDQKDPHNLNPLPHTKAIAEVEYRIAYIAFCLENSPSGRRLFEALRGVRAIDPENIQFCSAEWFWEGQANSYALQVEPDRFKDKDRATLHHQEALVIEKVRHAFFDRVDELLKMELRR